MERLIGDDNKVVRKEKAKLSPVQLPHFTQPWGFGPFIGALESSIHSADMPSCKMTATFRDLIGRLRRHNAYNAKAKLISYPSS